MPPKAAGDLIVIRHDHSGWIATGLNELVRNMRRRNGIEPPQALGKLVNDFTSHARACQGTTAMDELAAWLQSVDEPQPLLVDKEGAAKMLSVSVRTIDRLISSKALVPVHIGSACRLRVSDIRSIADKGA